MATQGATSNSPALDQASALQPMPTPFRKQLSMRSWYSMGLAVIILFAACNASHDNVHRETFIDVKRTSDAPFTPLDYAVLRASVEHIARFAKAPKVTIEPQTLSVAECHDCDSPDTQEYILDRFEVSFTEFCQHLSSNTLEESFLDSLNDLDSGVPESEERNPIFVYLSQPAYTRSARAYLYLIETDRQGTGGSFFLCLKRSKGEWRIERELILGIE